MAKIIKNLKKALLKKTGVNQSHRDNLKKSLLKQVKKKKKGK